MNRLDPNPLSHAENGFEQIVEGLPDGVAVLTGQGETLNFNPAFARILGVAPEALKGLPLPFPLPSSALEARENRLKLKNGKILDVELHVREMTYEGRPARLVVLRDVTAVRERERALHESEERFALAF